MSTTKYWMIITLVMLVCGSAYAQVPLTSNDELWRVLDEGVQGKLTRSQKVMAKALDYNKKAEAFEKQIEALRQDEGRIKMGKIRKLERRRNSSIIQSKPYYEDAYRIAQKGFGKQIDIFGKQKPELKTDVEPLLKKSKDRYKQGRKLFNKSDRMTSAEQQIEMVFLGNQKMQESLKLQVEAIDAFHKGMYATMTVAKPIVADSVIVQTVAVTDSAKLVAPVAEVSPATSAAIQPTGAVATVPAATSASTTAAIAAPVAVVAATGNDKPAVQQPSTAAATSSTQPEVAGDVFITIQILASKTAATPEQIKQAYSGAEKVMELVSADYHRYAVGRFRTADEAKAQMAAKGIKGIVVAFKGNDRISVAEATTILSGVNH